MNWFRKNADGKWLWPGYGENSRVLKWICERVAGNAEAQTTPIGNLPTTDALDLSDLDLASDDLAELLSVDIEGWKTEAAKIAADYKIFGAHLPSILETQLNALRKRLNDQDVSTAAFPFVTPASDC